MTEYVRKKGTREVHEVAAGEGTTMQVLIGTEEAPNFAFRKFTMAPNGGMPKHTNTVEHEQYVLSGSASVEIGGQTYKLSTGDSLFIPAGVPHSYRAGNDGYEFICVVPNEEDKVEIVE